MNVKAIAVVSGVDVVDQVFMWWWWSIGGACDDVVVKGAEVG